MNPIYEPKGKAKEYGDYALNIYTGCPHKCFYCFAPNVLHTTKEKFHSCISPRKNIIEETKKQIERQNITGKTIHLCFTCDPYPLGYDNSPTREIIKILKAAGNHVQILTKNGRAAIRDFDLLDENDWFGITYAGYELGYLDKTPPSEPNSGTPHERLEALHTAFQKGIKTWVSAEPVLNATDILELIDLADYINYWKIGKLNYHPSDINWKDFGERAERALKVKGRWRSDFTYYIKEGLRAEMNK